MIQKGRNTKETHLENINTWNSRATYCAHTSQTPLRNVDRKRKTKKEEARRGKGKERK